MILTKEDVRKCLDHVKRLQTVCPLIDIHVSPYEVIFNEFDYERNPQFEGVFSITNERYTPPSIGPIRLESRSGKKPNKKHEEISWLISLMLYRKLYAHIGPRIFIDQMNLSGLSKVLLLPVVHPSSHGVEQVRWMFDLYKGDERFLFGYCIPNSVRDQDILPVIKNAIRDYQIKAIKVHPNITGIDLATKKGKQRIESILDACQKARMPLIIHGGVSPVLKNPGAKNYASLDNLGQIKWAMMDTPLVISHAGMMGCSVAEAKEKMPLLKRILAANDNVMIDISALGVDVLCLIFKQIDHQKILFGSDAIYFAQWSAVANFFYALRESVSNPEDSFIRIAGMNPAICLFPESGELKGKRP
jgi:predicted TIM-barrel fold metal-dependent hydrolase